MAVTEVWAEPWPSVAASCGRDERKPSRHGVLAAIPRIIRGPRVIVFDTNSTDSTSERAPRRRTAIRV